MLNAIAVALALSCIVVGMWKGRNEAGAFPGYGVVIVLPALYGLAIAAVAWAGPLVFRLAADLIEAAGWVLPCLSCAVTVGPPLAWFLTCLRGR